MRKRLRDVAGADLGSDTFDAVQGSRQGVDTQFQRGDAVRPFRARYRSRCRYRSLDGSEKLAIGSVFLKRVGAPAVTDWISPKMYSSTSSTIPVLPIRAETTAVIVSEGPGGWLAERVSDEQADAARNGGDSKPRYRRECVERGSRPRVH